MIPKTLSLISLAVLAAFSVHAGEFAKYLLLNTADFVSLAPDGEHVAMIEKSPEGGSIITIADTQNYDSDVTHASDGKGGKAEVTDLRWLDSEHLVVVATLDEGNGLYVFKLGDRSPVRLEREGNRKLLSVVPGTNRFSVMQTSDDSNDWSKVYEYSEVGGEFSARLLYEAPSKEIEVHSDSKGQVRLVKKPEESGAGNPAWYRIDADGSEVKLINLSPWTRVYGFHGSSSKVLAGGYLGGNGTSIATYDIESDKVAQVLTTHASFSLDKLGEIVFDSSSHKVAGFTLVGVELRSFWLDPRYKAAQGRIDQALAGSVNRIISYCESTNSALVERIYPMLPRQICLMNIESGENHILVHGGGRVLPNEVGATKLVTVPNRHGHSLPVVLTMPVGYEGGEVPLVIWIRQGVWNGLDRVEWSPEANFFAANGFAVARVNYRGSEGFLGDLSADLSKASGIRATFEDLDDVRRALVEAELVRADKVAVGGEGAGAWAAAYLAKSYPDRYQAALCINGLYDLEAAIDEKSGYNAKAGVELNFASSWSGMPKNEVLTFQMASGFKEFPRYTFVCYGKWSPREHQDQALVFVKSARKAGSNVKVWQDDWWGVNYDGFQRIEAFERAATVLKSAFK
ncbi:alpha/beta hydrolase family protein [Pelagicoccus albus]|uniref:Prolyl oligopeptidase family serine peptidase n=1 Tax=Pelagicoccus albus TaxID=415222 RepID=A0A7X1B3L8_9BACT|nr:prolyl oligopeptidase family serine peptidase [Pelagicoccus albus]MBC2605021.1 prolyl oligopeptidase family serine peptidase [Pelagicoccus albus]